MRLTLSDIFTALGYESSSGRGMTSVEFTGISTDTRTLQPGNLFLALTSGKDDGHSYVPHALRAGAAGLVVSRDVVAPRDVPLIRVPDTTVAYGLLARSWRDRFPLPVIGVTGSVGKTTTKEMLAAALSRLGPIIKTEASQNNETGVPKALLHLTQEHRAAVIEMGMRGMGQIRYLCGVARPTIGVITRIGDNHIELLGSRERIAEAKAELLEALPSGGVAVLNADDPFFETLRAKTRARVVTYGVENAADFQATDAAPSSGGWRFQVSGAAIEIASPSRHDIANAAAALAAAVCAGCSAADAAAGLQRYAPPPMRMEVIRLAAEDVTILNDAYNAAPDSMRSALATLREYPGGRKIAFLGDMKELGEFAGQAHRDLGAVIESLGGLDALYTVGLEARRIPNAAAHFSDSEDAAHFAGTELALLPGDIILIKGSRAMAMELVAKALAARSAEGRPHAS